MTASARQRSRSEGAMSAAFAEAKTTTHGHATAHRNRCGGQRPCLFLRTGWGRRPQCPGNQFRAHARIWSIPRRFTLVNRRLPLALPQSFGKLRNFHVSLPTLSAKSLRPCNTKTAHRCAEAVEDDISLWKAEENQQSILPWGTSLHGPPEFSRNGTGLHARGIPLPLGIWES